MANPHCLLFEPDAAGHHLQHVRHLTECLLEIGCRVSLFLQTDVDDRPEFRVHLGHLASDIEINRCLDPRRMIGLVAVQARVRELLDAMTSAHPDRVYVPYADQITQAATAFKLMHGSAKFRTPIEAQMMRGKHGYPLTSMRQRLSAAGSRWLIQRNPWHVSHLLDPWALRGLGLTGETDRFRLIPEPVERLIPADRQGSRRRLEIPADGRYITMIGLMEPRKGIEKVLESFSQAKLDNDDRLLLVGKMSSPIRSLLDDRYERLLRQQRIVVVDRYVSDEELSGALFASDVVAVAHPRQIGSSGALVRAAAAERYLLTSDYGWIGWATDTFKLGTSVDVLNIGALTAALEEAMQKCGSYGRNEAAVRFCQYHTVANQQAHWVRSMGEECGVPLGRFNQLIEWQWVLDAVR
jgi:glycosyltransferase involved in cell wall biosynthesis